MVEVYNVLAYVLVYIGLFLLSFYLISFYRTPRRERTEKSGYESVTIIIPAYNEEASIGPTIESALALDYPRDRLEIIVVDDGSKDRTYERARRFVSPNVRVYRKPNGGKGSALNFGIARARGEIILTMDADTFAEPQALKCMIARFYSKDVMAVTSAMGVYKPRTVWQRIQHVEYYLSLFLRRTFAGINAIYITPGAFSAYRKVFFEQHGGYQEGNITEDLEIALRIQSHNYIIENAPDASFYTIAPATFKELLFQRRRWYTGLIKNLWAYRRLFGFKRGALGSIVLPASVITVFLSVFLTAYGAIRIVRDVRNELISLGTINFHFSSAYELNSYLFSRLFYLWFSHPVFLFTLFFICVLGFYLAYARRQMNYKESLKVNFIIFIALYSILFSFWWALSFGYVLFNRRVKWGVVHG